MFVRSFTQRRLFTALPWYLAPSDDSGQGAGDDDGGEDGDGQGGDDRTFSQDDLKRIVGKEAGKAERQAASRLLGDLGVKDAAEAKRIIEAARKAQEKDQSELDKAKAKADEAETKAEKADREAADARLELKIDRKLLAADVDKKRLARVAKLVKAELEGDTDDDAVAEAIETIKADMPELFKTDGDADPPKKKTGPAPSGHASNGQGPGTRGKTGTTGLDAGRERARARQGRTEQKTA